MRTALFITLALFATPIFAQVGPTSEFTYPHRMLPDAEGSYEASIPSPEQTLGFRVGDRAAFPAEIIDVFEAMAEASPKATMFEYARTYEGRPSVYMAISSATNISRLNEIKSDLAKLSDPRTLSSSEADRILAGTPVTAWLAYSIHGDETSGADASMLVAYHLIASQSQETADWLDRMVILIDPMQNPDGRQRYLNQVTQHRGVSPNVDDQSLLHSGYWPWGRTNHYLFDMNRDWLLGVNPEPRGRIVAAREWYPLLLVDAHEMGAQETYLFSPDVEPLNQHFPGYLEKWQQSFGQDQAAAFDARGWPYYSGEWADNWYPGYGSSWGKLIGAVAILYEQAGLTEDGVRRPEGTVITYHEAVHHQALSSWSNLRSLYAGADELQRGFFEDRKAMVSTSGPYAKRSWAILPTANRTRLASFLDKMDLQGIGYHVASAAFTARSGRDQLGRAFGSREIPAGSILISNRQPGARITAAALEFDPKLSEDILKKERSEVLKTGGGVMYDVTAWNLLMYYGLDAVELDQDHVAGDAGQPASSEEAADAAVRAASGSRGATQTQSSVGMAAAVSKVGYVVDGADDASLAFAARLMEKGVFVRVAEKPFRLDSVSFTRGSIVVQNTDNRDCGASIPGEMMPGYTDRVPEECDLLSLVVSTANELNLAVHSAGTGQGKGDLPDLGGRNFDLLQRPQIALVAREGVSSYSFGSIWHAIDTKLGIRHSHLDGNYTDYKDLRRYNVIVLPGNSSWDADFLEMLKPWVEQGGTLIAIGQSAFSLATEKSGLTKVRLLRDVLGDLDDYEMAVHRDWQAQQKTIPDVSAVFSHTPGAEGPVAWDPGYDRPDTTALAREDEWRRLFMPAGAALLAGRTNPEHWLTYGVGGSLAVLYNGSSVLMAGSGVQSAVRAGTLSAKEGAPSARVGWSSVPSGYELSLRQSGLLWPEAGQRIANAPLVTRESVGKGQVVLMAFEPTFRGTMHEDTRVLFNAIVLGPGVGAHAIVEP
ncbi:M14 family metallopeptidase [Bacteroidota bacterium]